MEAISKMGWVKVREQMKKTPRQEEYIKQQVLNECRVVFNEFKRGPNYVGNMAIYDDYRNCTEEQKEWRRKARRASGHFRKMFGGEDEMIIEMLGVKHLALPKRGPFDIIKNRG